MAKFSTDRSLNRFQLMGYASVAVIVGVLGSWAVFAQLNGAVVAAGTVVAESNTKRIQHKDGGVVREILVKDGDRVTAGQDLVILDDTETRAELGIIQALLVEELAKKARLEAQRDDAENVSFPQQLEARRNEPEVASVLIGQEKLFSARRAAVKGKIDQLNEQIGQVAEQVDGFTAQIAAKERQIELITGELKDLTGLLEKGLMQKSRVLAMEREQAKIEGERGELIASRAAAQSKSSEIKLQILQIGEEVLTQTLSELREAESRVAELSERQLAAQARLDRMVVKAPITGTVYQSMIHTIGGVITPAEPLLMIAPEEDELVLQAHVSPQNIEQVHEGQLAHVLFPAFNTRTTPQIKAEVVNVAADTSRFSADSPPFYDVRLHISKEELAKLGDKKLKHGMPAEAFIQTGARSPMSYLVKPLMDQINHAWRER